MIGKTVSHYRITGSLGAGGMGVVYSGEDVRLHRPVALKFVPEELAKDRQAVERLHSEARTASGLNHANICTIYDIGDHEGQPFIVMELLQGETLRERLESHAPLKIRDAVELGIQVADALDAAHHRSIIHRDIKPANLFLVDRGLVKVVDFGLAKPVSRRSDITVSAGVTRDQTAEGVTLGTVSYMSPEQVTGDDLDGRSDIFSLGVVLYEALTGHQPFTGKTSAVIFSAILTRAPVAPVVLNPEVPLRLQEVVNNCLEKDRELRYQNAADLRADLKRVRRDLESGQSGVFTTTASSIPVAGSDQAIAATRASSSRTRAPSSSTGAATAPAPIAEAGRKPWGLVIGAIVATAAVIVGAMWLRPRPAPSSPAADATAQPRSLRTQIAAATASLDSKDYRAALAYAEEALRLSPGDADAVRVRDAARGILARFDDAVAQANQRLAANDPDGATAALNTARAIDGTSPALADLSARIAAQSKAAENARTADARRAAAPAPRSETKETKDTNRARPADSRRSATVPPPPVAQVLPEPPAPRVVPPSTPQPEPAAPAAPAPTQAAAPPVVRPAPPQEPPPAPAPAAQPPARPDPPASRESAPPARPAESDDAVIRRVIATYARAIETKDLALFRSVKPNMNADEQRRVETGFRAVDSQQVGITIVSIDVKGQEATAHLRRRDTIQAGGRQQTSDSLQTMILTRAAAGWVIREIGR